MSEQINHKLNRYIAQKTDFNKTKNSRHYEFLVDLYTNREYQDIIHSFFSSHICRSILMSYSLNPNTNILIEPLSIKYGNISGFVEQNRDNNEYYEMYINSYKYKWRRDDCIQNVDKNLHSYIQKDDILVMKAYDKTHIDTGVNFEITLSNDIYIANLKTSFNRKNYILTIDNKEVCTFIIEEYINNDQQVNILIPNTLFYSEGKKNIIKEWLHPSIDIIPTIHRSILPKKLIDIYKSKGDEHGEYWRNPYFKPPRKLQPIYIKNGNNYIIQVNDSQKSHQQRVEFETPMTPLIAFSIALIRFNKF